MKLSLWIIADWLRKYDTRRYIKEGGAEIVSVRFLSEKLDNLPKEYVYISNATSAFHDLVAPQNTVLLIHQNDFLLVEGLNPDNLLNEVLNAFDFYNYWEVRLWKAAMEVDPFQKISDLSTEVMESPLTINDCEGNILALNHVFDPDDVDDRWKELYRTGIIPLSCTSPPIQTIENETVADWSATPRQYQYRDGVKYICANIYNDGEQVATLYIQQYHKVFTQGHCQLAEIICKVLTATISSIQSDIVFSNTSVLMDLLSGKPVRVSAEKYFLEKYNWQSPWYLIVIQNYPANSSPMKQRNLLNNIRKLGSISVSLIFDGNVVAITDSGTIKDFLIQLQSASNMYYYAVGISLPFYHWEDLSFQYKQALFCLEENIGGAGIYYCEDCGFSYLMASVMEENQEMNLCHPALIVLQEYDKQHKTQLFETLFQYISLERNLVKTAEALYIHRNSLVYRIGRIKELVNCSFDDPKERAFLLLSFHLYQQGEMKV